MSGKQLELLKEIVPKLSRVAIFGNSTNPGNAQALREADSPHGSYGIYLRYLDVQDPKDIGPCFRAATKGRADASSGAREPHPQSLTPTQLSTLR